MRVSGYAAKNAGASLETWTFERVEAGDKDVSIDIRYCGICHSDVHQVRNEWGGKTIFPIVPGHEITGVVSKVGTSVTRFKIGDRVGVGCMVDSDRRCEHCRAGEEQYCPKIVPTYNGRYKDGTPTYGGYSTHIVVPEEFVLRLPNNLDFAEAAPLLCAGITTYSPLRHWKVGKGTRVGVMGLGGLGHMAVKIAAALGAEVTVFSHSHKKEKDARRFGAHQFVVTAETGVLEKLYSTQNFIINTVSAPHDLDPYLRLLQRDGTMVLVGIPPESPTIRPGTLIGGRRAIAGSLIGGIRETQEMLDFCAEHKITSDIEKISAQEINRAYDRMVQSDVRYRFVIDISTMA